MVDARVSNTLTARCVGSSPTARTNIRNIDMSVKLPLVGAFTLRDAHYHLPRMIDNKLGMYGDTSESFERDTVPYDRMFRIETRIGCNIAFPPDLPKEHEEHIVKESRGRVFRFIYGPIEQELLGLLYDLRNEGASPHHPSVIRLTGLLNDLRRAFRGDLG
jgi:hypothetical protein